MMDLHTHTVYCDGKNTPEEMVLAALDRGMDCLGFSEHTYTYFDESCCMSPLGTAAYQGEVRALAEKYASRLRILCGAEQDYWSDESTAAYDYVIGSVHYLRSGDGFFPVDESPEFLREAVDRQYGGDWYAMAEDYYALVSRVAEKTGCDIIGHFDLVSKFNEKYPFFDETHPRYAEAWQRAADILLKTGKPFEINTGAVSRGWRTGPYPRDEMIEYIAQRGGRFILSSDAHSADTLCFGFFFVDVPERLLIRSFEELKKA